MRVAGIIAEYNPFHNGHEWHVAETRRLTGCEAVVAVMSGNFVQRGEPAMFDKWARAEMAARSGVDLVLELPAAFTVRSAQYFAAGGVRLLAALGEVDTVSFGAEHPQLDALEKLAGAVDDEAVVCELRDRLDSGLPYAAALGRALAARTGLPATLVASPNNILAVEYIRALRRYAPHIRPLAVARRQAGYHDRVITGNIASATAVRAALGGESAEMAYAALPPASQALIAALSGEGRGPVAFNELATVLLSRLRQASLAELAALPDVAEGLEYKLREAGQAGSLSEALAVLKSRRYSQTRLQRILIYAMLGASKAQFSAWDASGPLYARVLAFGDSGRRLLRRLASTAALPLIGKTSRFLKSREIDDGDLSPLQAMLAFDTRASDLYVLAMPNPDFRRGGWDFRRSPLYIASPGCGR